VGKIFKDNSKSAWNPKVVRKDWEELMRRLEAGASDGVWVLDLTRFSRKVIEGERLVEAARRGRLVWSQAGEYNLTTADGRKAFRDAMAAAAAESDKISERSRRGKRRLARRGVNPIGSPGFGMPRWLPKPDGWEKGDPRERVPAEVIERERDAIRDCYKRLFAGTANVSALASELNAKGMLTVGGSRGRGACSRTR
jgi:DNA invertase Pin-like site-specific DNA recombinase